MVSFILLQTSNLNFQFEIALILLLQQNKKYFLINFECGKVHLETHYFVKLLLNFVPAKFKAKIKKL